MKSLLRSFAGGEIAPEMFGRLDLTKFQTGLQRSLNFRTLPHGPAQRRPGFYFTNECKDSAHRVRLIPFAFSATQAVAIEFGHLYVRFHTSSGTLLEANQVISSIVGDTVNVTAHGWAVGDNIFISSAYYRVATVPTADQVTVTRLDGVAGAPAGTTAARVYTLVSPYTETDLPTICYTQNSDVLTLTAQGQAVRELRRSGATSWAFNTVSFVATITPPAGVTCVATKPTPTNVTAQLYKVTAVATDGVTESLASTAATDTNNLGIAGNFNTIAWGAVVGAARYYVYKQRGGAYGYIGQTTDLTIKDDNILPDILTTPPENSISLNGGANDYPGAVTYHEQRRWFAGTINKPQSIWATRNGTDSNLTSSVPSRDDDGLEFRIAAQQQNAIRHLVPLVDLIALTAGGEFRIFADGQPFITPSSLSIKPQSYSGSSKVQPALTAASALYVQAQGSRVRELAYDPQGQGTYRSLDVSLFAPHLFNGYSVTELAYARAPDQTLWAVRSDGVLLGLTYVPDQQVFGWHQHSTGGQFESAAVIPEGGEDVLYVVVNRSVNGRTVRYIERLVTSVLTDPNEAFFVDAGLTYRGAPTSTITGLYHLEGKLVSALADAAVIAPQTVVDGTIALPSDASVVHVGLAYNSDLQTLPLAYDNAPAGGQGTMKNVSAVSVRVTQSSLLKAGPAFIKLTEYPARAVSDPYGSPPALRTGELRLAISPSWNTDGAICIRQDQPLPLTVLSIALEAQAGG